MELTPEQANQVLEDMQTMQSQRTVKEPSEVPQTQVSIADTDRYAMRNAAFRHNLMAIENQIIQYKTIKEY